MSYTIQWQSKKRIGVEGVPLCCNDFRRVERELTIWYDDILGIIKDWKSDTSIRILYPLKKINLLKKGESVEVFEVVTDICPELVIVSYIDNG